MQLLLLLLLKLLKLLLMLCLQIGQMAVVALLSFGKLPGSVGFYAVELLAQVIGLRVQHRVLCGKCGVGRLQLCKLRLAVGIGTGELVVAGFSKVELRLEPG